MQGGDSIRKITAVIESRKPVASGTYNQAFTMAFQHEVHAILLVVFLLVSQ
jgi:hypothetical protein